MSSKRKLSSKTTGDGALMFGASGPGLRLLLVATCIATVACQLACAEASNRSSKQQAQKRFTIRDPVEDLARLSRPTTKLSGAAAEQADAIAVDQMTTAANHQSLVSQLGFSSSMNGKASLGMDKGVDNQLALATAVAGQLPLVPGRRRLDDADDSVALASTGQTRGNHFLMPHSHRQQFGLSSSGNDYEQQRLFRAQASGRGRPALAIRRSGQYNGIVDGEGSVVGGFEDQEGEQALNTAADQHRARKQQQQQRAASNLNGMRPQARSHQQQQQQRGYRVGGGSGFARQESRKRQRKPTMQAGKSMRAAGVATADAGEEDGQEERGEEGDAEKASDRRADSFDLEENDRDAAYDKASREGKRRRSGYGGDNEDSPTTDSYDNAADDNNDDDNDQDDKPRSQLRQAASAMGAARNYGGLSRQTVGNGDANGYRYGGNGAAAGAQSNLADENEDEDEEAATRKVISAVELPNSGHHLHQAGTGEGALNALLKPSSLVSGGYPGETTNLPSSLSAATAMGLSLQGNSDGMSQDESLLTNSVKNSAVDLHTAAGSHHGSHGHHYYQYVEVPKKKAWKFGFKRGNHKHTIERHEKGHKNKFHSSFKWHAKEKCKKKKKCKSVGKMTWDYKHHDKKHHG